MDKIDIEIKELVRNYLSSTETPTQNDKHIRESAIKLNKPVSLMRGKFNDKLDEMNPFR